jgi:hypothetical protein
MRKISIAMLALVPLLAGGCVAKTVVGVATAPVKVAGKLVDWTTTSQSEADRNAGRKLRKQQERDAKEAKKEAKRREREAREASNNV